MTKAADHVVVHDSTQGENAWMVECKHCGEKQRFALPIILDVWLAAAKAFEKLHRRCKKKP